MARLVNIVAGLVAVAVSGCTLPVAVWPEFPAGLGENLTVLAPDGKPVSEGHVLLRVYEYDGAGVAEGDRNVRNQQALDAAFEDPRPIWVNVPEGTTVKYRLIRLDALPVGLDGTARVPMVLGTGALWVVHGTEKARGGLHRRFHFADVQALAPGYPPSSRLELKGGLSELRLGKHQDPAVWNRELQFALKDIERANPEAFVIREVLEEELARLAAAEPEAFETNAVGGMPDARTPQSDLAYGDAEPVLVPSLCRKARLPSRRAGIGGQASVQQGLTSLLIPDPYGQNIRRTRIGTDAFILRPDAIGTTENGFGAGDVPGVAPLE